MSKETESVTPGSKADRDSALRERLLQSALEGSGPPDPFAHIPMLTIAGHLGEAESSLLYQVDTSDGSDPLSAFRALAYVRTIERFRSSVGVGARGRVVESLVRGDALPEVLAQFFAALSEQFESDPSTRYLLGVVARFASVAGLEEAARQAWLELSSEVNDVVALVVAAHGQTLLLDRAHMDELVAVSITGGWVQENLVSKLDYERPVVDGGCFGASGLLFWAGLRAHLVPYSKESQTDLGEDLMSKKLGKGPGRTDRRTELGLRALDAAVDLLLEGPATLPLSRSITQLCRAVGIGASTFYRLFADVEEFRQALVLFHINSEFNDSDLASATQMVSSLGTHNLTGAATASLESDSASNLECAAVLGSASSALFESTDDPGIDSEYVPWLGVSEVAEAMRRSYKASEQAHVDTPVSFLEATGRQHVGSSSNDDFMRRIISATIGFGLTQQEQKWDTLAQEGVCIATYLHVVVTGLMTTPLFPQRPD